MHAPGTLDTRRLILTPATPQELLEKWQGPDGTFPAAISPQWIEQLRVARDPDPWVFGYWVFDRESNARIGSCGFKGEPGAGGVVEIAYGIDEDRRLRGYATEVAAALTAFAFDDVRVRIVCACTAPGAEASGRVLLKNAFVRVDDVIDPEDGPLWRFEKTRERA